MDKRILGSGLEVSEIGLGCMGFSHAYGTACDKDEAVRMIRKAADMGYTFFDTAECYTGLYADGTVSYNEELVGEALAPIRSRVVIATKGGVRHDGDSLTVDSRPETLRASVEGSLKRLGTDVIDLYYQHRIDPKVKPEEVAGTMQELIKEGKILHWGISEATEEYLRRADAVCKVAVVQNHYSMMARWHESLFPMLEELNVGYVAFSPLANGFLTDAFAKGSTFEKGDFRNTMPQYQEEAYAANEKLLCFLRDMAEEKSATPAQISLAWMIRKKSYIVPIPGSRKEHRLMENAGASEVKLTEADVRTLDEALDHMEMSGVFGGHAAK